VIVNLEIFSPPTVKFLQQKLLPQLEQWNPVHHRVAFLISSNTSVQEMAFSRLASHPPVLRKHLIKKGVAATGFSDEKILFLIDLEKLITSKQIFRKDEPGDLGAQE